MKDVMESSNHRFHHPHDPYHIQQEFMTELYACLEHGNIGIFESPTGTGKSLSLICAALTWLRDNEKREIFGATTNDESLDWLQQAEEKAQQRQLMDTRREKEEELKTIRIKTAREVAQRHPAKKVKIDDKLQEDDFMLEEYESDQEKYRTNNSDQTLSAATQALLDQLRPLEAHGEEESDQPRTKIIFCSRTHSQLTQVVDELRKIDLPSAVLDGDEGEVVKHVPLGSRKTLCINPKVSRLVSTTAINERCLELQKPGTSKDHKCEFLPSKQSPDGQDRLETFKDHAIAQIQDIEDIANLGRRLKTCPYYASRSAIPVVEILTLPYPLLLQKGAREALGIEINNNIVIVDEAHNLTSAIADILSVSVPLSHLELAQAQLLAYCQKFKNKLKGKNRVYIAQIIRLMKACISRLQLAATSKVVEQSLLAHDLTTGAGLDQIQPYKLARYIQDSKLVYKIEGYAQLVDEQAQQARTYIGDQQKHKPKGVLAEFQSLLVALMNPGSEGKFFITRDNGELVLRYTLLDPQAHFDDIVQEARAVILAGGTMSPMTDWADQMFPFVPAERLKTYTFGHIVDKENVMVEPLSKGPTGMDLDFTWNARRSEGLILELALLVEKISAVTPDGMIVFFPSYDYLALVATVWKRGNGHSTAFDRIFHMKQIFQESKEVNVDNLLRDYTDTVSAGKGAIMLAVVGGKLSEGINFSDKLGRVVICVGLPYPNIKSIEWQAKVEYIERVKYSKCKRESLSEKECKTRAQAAGREYADNTTMRAVNQSIGRAIRHKNDYAAVFLVDKRYTSARIQNKLPAWLKESIHTGEELWQTTENRCKDFFHKRNLHR